MLLLESSFLLLSLLLFFSFVAVAVVIVVVVARWWLPLRPGVGGWCWFCLVLLFALMEVGVGGIFHSL